MNISKPLLQIAAKYAPTPSHKDIAALAQKFWKQGGQNAESNWLLAEAQLKAELIANFANNLQKSLSPVIQELTGQLVELSEEHDAKLAEKIGSHLHAEDVKEVLGDNLKFYRNYGDSQISVFEDLPKIRTLYMDLRFNTPRIGSYTSGSHAYDRGNGHEVPVALGLPYIVYVVRTHFNSNGMYYARDLSVSFSNKPLKSLEQTVYTPLLPNVSPGRVCLSYKAQNYATVTEAALEIIDAFWQSQFNYMLFRPDRLPENISTFELWAAKTKENPLFVLGVEWPTSKYNLNEIIYDFGHHGQIAKLKKIIADNKQMYIKEIRKVLEEMSDLHPIKPVV